jgi:hypothetical protein
MPQAGTVRTLTITRNGGQVVTILLAPRTTGGAAPQPGFSLGAD